MSKPHRKTRKKWNQDIPDSVLLIHSTRSAMDRPESLCPTAATLDRFVAGIPEARAIVYAYQLVAPIIEVRA
jgi:hypothetical protein